MISTVRLIEERGKSQFLPFTTLAIGTLMAEGTHKCANAKETDLNRWASATKFGRLLFLRDILM
jgi:hypothetical protein